MFLWCHGSVPMVSWWYWRSGIFLTKLAHLSTQKLASKETQNFAFGILCWVNLYIHIHIIFTVYLYIYNVCMYIYIYIHTYIYTLYIYIYIQSANAVPKPPTIHILIQNSCIFNSGLFQIQKKTIISWLSDWIAPKTTEKKMLTILNQKICSKNTRLEAFAG
jgi:hypothetical protein